MIVVHLPDQQARGGVARRIADHHGRNQISCFSFKDQVAIAVPVSRHHRQAARHGFDDDQAEGLLNVIDQRCEEVRRLPDSEAETRVGAIDHGDAYVGCKHAGAVKKCTPDLRRGGPTREQ